MKFKLMTTSALVLFAGAALTLSLTTATASLSASSERSGSLHVVKECSEYKGQPGDSCTFTSANAVIPFGSKIFYDQALGIPAGLVDSNVVVDAGDGNRAHGRCTLDLSTSLGLCTFSDGTGRFAGFEARLNVSYAGGASFRLDGRYSFSPDHRRREDDR